MRQQLEAYESSLQNHITHSLKSTLTLCIAWKIIILKILNFKCLFWIKYHIFTSVSNSSVILNITFMFFIDVILFIINLEVALINVINSLTLLSVNVDFKVIFFNELSEHYINDDEKLSLIKTVNQLIFFFIINIAYFTVFFIKLIMFLLLMQFSAS